MHDARCASPCYRGSKYIPELRRLRQNREFLRDDVCERAASTAFTRHSANRLLIFLSRHGAGEAASYGVRARSHRQADVHADPQRRLANVDPPPRRASQSTGCKYSRLWPSRASSPAQLENAEDADATAQDEVKEDRESGCALWCARQRTRRSRQRRDDTIAPIA